MSGKKKRGSSPMDSALKYLAQKPRTVCEVELHLDALQFGEFEVYQAVERLKELGYLDDEKYAGDFVATRLATKPVSRKKLSEQLRAHHVPKEAAAIAMEQVTQEVELKNALAVAKKFAQQFAALEPQEQKLRTMRRLLGRGYEYGAIFQSVEQVFGSAEEIGLDCLQAEEDE